MSRFLRRLGVDDDAVLGEKAEPDTEIFSRNPVKLPDQLASVQWLYCKFAHDCGVDGRR
jgi:hypothetical protein